jgi:hypothetical protein
MEKGIVTEIKINAELMRDLADTRDRNSARSRFTWSLFGNILAYHSARYFAQAPEAVQRELATMDQEGIDAEREDAESLAKGVEGIQDLDQMMMASRPSESINLPAAVIVDVFRFAMARADHKYEMKAVADDPAYKQELKKMITTEGAPLTLDTALKALARVKNGGADVKALQGLQQAGQEAGKEMAEIINTSLLDMLFRSSGIAIKKGNVPLGRGIGIMRLPQAEAQAMVADIDAKLNDINLKIEQFRTKEMPEYMYRFDADTKELLTALKDLLTRPGAQGTDQVVHLDRTLNTIIMGAYYGTLHGNNFTIGTTDLKATVNACNLGAKSVPFNGSVITHPVVAEVEIPSDVKENIGEIALQAKKGGVVQNVSVRLFKTPRPAPSKVAAASQFSGFQSWVLSLVGRFLPNSQSLDGIRQSLAEQAFKLDGASRLWGAIQGVDRSFKLSLAYEPFLELKSKRDFMNWLNEDSYLAQSCRALISNPSLQTRAQFAASLDRLMHRATLAGEKPEVVKPEEILRNYACFSKILLNIGNIPTVELASFKDVSILKKRGLKSVANAKIVIPVSWLSAIGFKGRMGRMLDELDKDLEYLQIPVNRQLINDLLRQRLLYSTKVSA